MKIPLLANEDASIENDDLCCGSGGCSRTSVRLAADLFGCGSIWLWILIWLRIYLAVNLSP